MSDELVHIAGLDVTVGSQQRQRCAWCGAVLLDVDLSTIMVEIREGEEPQAPGAWPIGRLVLTTGEQPRVSRVVDQELDEDGVGKLPDNACACLPHEVTGTPGE